MSFLAVKKLCVDFGGIRAVKDVSFEIEKGKTLALVGESGSGKSVSASAIVNLLPQTARITGSILYRGRELVGASNNLLREIRGNDISFIFQEPMTSLNPLHTIEKQIGESLRLHRGLIGKEAQERVLELLNKVGIRDVERRLNDYPHQLSGGQRQRVMIAMALANEPELLIADEPTTALDVTIEAQILDLLKELQKSENLSMLFITHDLGVVRRISDKVAVMEKGIIVEKGTTDRIFEQPEHPYTRKLLSAEAKGFAPPLAENALNVINVEKLKVAFPIKRGVLHRTVGHFEAVKSADFTIHQGETLGVVGESGSGKTTLALAVMRLIDSSGKIYLGDNPLHEINNRQMRRYRSDMQIVFQDPYGSLSPRLTVEQIITEGLEVHGQQNKEDRESLFLDTLHDVGLEPEMRHRYPHEFSGGQRQRIAIARAMILRPKFVVLDEPTSALDMTVQVQIVSLLRDLQQRYGLAYIFISHDLRVVRAMSHKIIVIREGEIVESGAAEQVFTAPQHDYSKILMSAFTD